MDDHATEMIGSSRDRALAVLRVALGAMFVWVFFENLGKGAYTPAGYKGVIDYYVKNGHSPAVWKELISVAAANARVVAAAAGAFLFTLWVSELGTSWIWELGMPVIVAFSLAWARAGRTWGVDALIARRNPGWRLG